MRYIKILRFFPCILRMHLCGSTMSVICIHELFRRMNIYGLEEREFKNFEGKPLNKEFIDFLIWESNMVLRLKELSGTKPNKQFQKVDIFSRESEIEDDEFHETENL